MTAREPVMAAQLTLDLVVEAIGPLEKWARQCHQASLALVRSGILHGNWRVARGWCDGITSQHSWATTRDPYARYAGVVDVTRWSYQDVDPYVYVGLLEHSGCTPHGAGDIWKWGCPVAGDGPIIELTPKTALGVEARAFLEMVGPLDRRGWGMLAQAPVGGNWGAGEIFGAMADTEALAALVPIDKLGMTTDRNPQGLYR